MTRISRTTCVALAAAFTLGALATPAVIAAPARGYYVLSIGVGEYKDATIHKLPSAADATKVAKLFKDRVGATTLTLTNRQATIAGIETALAEIKDKARKGDFVVIFLAGHGTPVNKGKDWVFLPHDFERENGPKTAVWDTTLLRTASDLADRGHDVLLAVESCHSGMLIPRARMAGLVDVARAKRKGRGGLAVATSCKPSQVSFASWMWGTNRSSGWFSTALCDGLGGEADANRDGVVSLAELRGFLEARLQIISRTLPRLPGMSWTTQDSLCLGSPEASEAFAIAPGDRKHGKTRRMVEDEEYIPPGPDMLAEHRKGPAPVGTWKLVKRERAPFGASAKKIAMPVDGSYQITFGKDGSYVAVHTPGKGKPERAKGTYLYQVGGRFELISPGGCDRFHYFGRTAKWMRVRLESSEARGLEVVDVFLEFERVGD